MSENLRRTLAIQQLGSDQHPEAVGAKLAMAAKRSDRGLYTYAPAITTIAENLIPITQGIEAAGNKLIADHNLGGSKKAEAKLVKYAIKMRELCEQITDRTDFDEDKRREIIRELWNCIKQTPKIMADGVGFTLEQLADPKIIDSGNPYIPLMKQLAEARDGIYNEMKFETKYSNKFCLAPRGIGIICAVIVGPIAAMGIRAVFHQPFSLGAILSGTAVALVWTLYRNRDNPTYIIESIPDKIESEDHIQAFGELAGFLAEKDRVSPYFAPHGRAR